MSAPVGGRASTSSTLRVCGILLLVAGCLSALGAMVRGSGFTGVIFVITDLAFAAALVAAAFGIGASLVARRTVAVVALCVWAVCRLATPVLSFLPYTRETIPVLGAASTALTVITLAAAIVSVVEIGRAGVITGSQRWLPAWALIAVAAPQVLMMLAAVAAPGTLVPDGPLLILVAVSEFLPVVALIGLGIVALLHAQQPGGERPAVPVFPDRP